jgi:hypothetical protein
VGAGFARRRRIVASLFAVAGQNVIRRRSRLLPFHVVRVAGWLLFPIAADGASCHVGSRSTGVSDASTVAPESYTLDAALVARPGNEDIQLDLFLDYATNVTRYPEFQAYFRRYQPAILAVWGKNDPFFLPPGAEAFKRDSAKAEVRFFDTGHFALETHAEEIGMAIHRFLDRTVARK